MHSTIHLETAMGQCEPLWRRQCQQGLRKKRMGATNPSQEGYYNRNKLLVEGVPHIVTGLHLSAGGL